MVALMAKNVTTLQTNIRHVGRDSNITVASGVGLARLNTIYRGICSLLPWSELRRQDTSITTTATGTYTWPTTIVFLDVKAIEMQDGDDEDRYKLIFAPPDEWQWNEAERRPKQAVPDYYVRSYTAPDHKIEFRPLSKHTGKTVRITGIIEPRELKSAADKTVFIQKAADDALEYLIAADYLSVDGFAEYAADRMQRAMEIFQNLFGKDQVPSEQIATLIRN